MAMIGGLLRKKRVVSGVTGEVISPRDSQQGLDLVEQGLSVGPHRSVMPNPFEQPDMGPMTVGDTRIDIPVAPPRRKFFTDDGTGTGNRIVGILGDALSGAVGQEGMYAKTMEQRRQEQTAFERGEVQYQRRRADELADRTADANKVQYFSGNEDRVAFDPTTGTSRTLYDAPTQAETYANTLGLAPDSPAYGDAIRDYVLRGYGPTAYSGKEELQADRYGRMGGLQASRLATSRRNTDARNDASILNNMRRTVTTQRGQDMTDARTRGSAAYQGRGGRGSPAAARAIDPKTGHAIVVRNGQWVDEKTGKPVG